MSIIKIENGEISEVTESRANKLEIIGAEIQFSNFAGKASKYNAEGKRNVELRIPEDVAIELAKMGWRIRKNGYDPDLDRRRTGGMTENLEDPEYRLKVNINLDSRNPPKLFKKTSKHLIPLDGKTVNSLDYDEIEDLFIVVNGYDGQQNDMLSGYLDTLVATIVENSFYKLFGDMPIANNGSDEAMPWD